MLNGQNQTLLPSMAGVVATAASTASRCSASAPDFVGREQREKLGLSPGERANGTFRIRFKCPIGGGLCDGRADMPMQRDWQAFSYDPRTKDTGRAGLQAYRLTMYARRNTCEAIFGALKLGQKLGLGERRSHAHREREHGRDAPLAGSADADGGGRCQRANQAQRDACRSAAGSARTTPLGAFASGSAAGNRRLADAEKKALHGSNRDLRIRYRFFLDSSESFLEAAMSELIDGTRLA